MKDPLPLITAGAVAEVVGDSGATAGGVPTKEPETRGATSVGGAAEKEPETRLGSGDPSLVSLAALKLPCAFVSPGRQVKLGSRPENGIGNGLGSLETGGIGGGAGGGGKSGERCGDSCRTDRRGDNSCRGAACGAPM